MVVVVVMMMLVMMMMMMMTTMMMMTIRCMCRRLRARGFPRVICCDSIGVKGQVGATKGQVFNAKGQVCDDAFARGQVYDVVALMNILDRCHEPLQVVVVMMMMMMMIMIMMMMMMMLALIVFLSVLISQQSRAPTPPPPLQLLRDAARLVKPTGLVRVTCDV